jgi:hypothetical protein
MFVECKTQMKVAVQKFSLAFSLMRVNNVKFSVEVDHNVLTRMHMYIVSSQKHGSDAELLMLYLTNVMYAESVVT